MTDPTPSVDVDAHLASYMAHVAAALNSIPKCEASYGEFYVGEAVIVFDGEPTQFSVVVDEHGSYSIRVRSLA